MNGGHRPGTDSTSSPVATASRGYAEIPGGRLYYQAQGRGSGLVLLGGGPANADTLAPLASLLADDYTVVTYDRRGYSRSRLDDPGEETTISRHSDDLRRLAPMADRLIVAGSQAGRDYYPYQCALRLAEHLGQPLVELPGNHAGMIQQPAQFAVALKHTLTGSRAR